MKTEGQRESALEVRDFYDQYPYPPPVEDFDTCRENWQDPARERWASHRFWPTGDFALELLSFNIERVIS